MSPFSTMLVFTTQHMHIFTLEWLLEGSFKSRTWTWDLEPILGSVNQSNSWLGNCCDNQLGPGSLPWPTASPRVESLFKKFPYPRSQLPSVSAHQSSWPLRPPQCNRPLPATPRTPGPFQLLLYLAPERTVVFTFGRCAYPPWEYFRMCLVVLDSLFIAIWKQNEKPETPGLLHGSPVLPLSHPSPPQTLPINPSNVPCGCSLLTDIPHSTNHLSTHIMPGNL